ncbi:hypothetical protein L596_014404 [Steinernema carpocapsae]|uniref:SXP/RAL-2 family protein Ani s 5-like cation-binding domain-containing protein n=1 Tax=Steinernema carpocapsae TaxID=34508 RepID=A0A4V6A2S6_STECR|nr:hypothetical protein L596_014404 [Steinernema carpocapsae]
MHLFVLIAPCVIASLVASNEIDDLTAYAKQLIENGAKIEPNRVIYHYVPFVVPTSHYGSVSHSVVDSGYDSHRHFLDNIESDEKIAELHENNQKTVQHIDNIKETLANNTRDVHEQHSVHVVSVAEKIRKLDFQNQIIKKFHAIAEKSTQDVVKGHRKVVAEHEKNVVLMKISAELQTFYQQLYAKVMKLHGVVENHSKQNMKDLKEILQKVKEKKNGSEEKEIENEFEEQEVEEVGHKKNIDDFEEEFPRKNYKLNYH